IPQQLSSAQSSETEAERFVPTGGPCFISVVERLFPEDALQGRAANCDKALNPERDSSLTTHYYY
ncbi:uncharacterized, partial [Tachysurus ichikawai]